MSEEALREMSKWVPDLREGANGNYIGCCPLHGEVPGVSKPSFSFHASSGVWYCFSGCGGGNLWSFLEKVGKSSTYVEKAYSRIKPHLDAKEAKKKNPLRALRSREVLPEALLGLWEYCPTELVDAGFSEKVLEDHDVGVDTERDRITFPIRNIHGDLVGVSGRCSGGAGPKYRFYTKEFHDMGFRHYDVDPRDYLWRGERVLPQLMRDPSSPLYIVEGFKAALWMVQHGYETTVALMGSSISDSQLETLRRVGSKIILCLDDDRAGHMATLKVGQALRRHGGIRVINYPGGAETRLQPDDLPPAALEKAVGPGLLTLSKWRNKNHIPPLRKSRRSNRW